MTVIALVAGVALLAIGDPFGFIYFGVGIVETIAIFAITILILIQLSKRESSVPGKIQKLLTVQVALSIVCGLIIIPISDFSTNIEPDAAFEVFRGIAQSIAYFVVWNKYFGKSDRVQAVYTGETATNSKKVFVDLPSASTADEVRREVPEVVRSFES